MAVPNIFANVTTSIPLSQLDTNFATAITLGNTAVYLGNTTTTIGNLTLTNANVSSVSTPIAPAQGGTGLATLTANNVLIGNGTGNVTFVAPGTTGNALISNGTVWASSAVPAGSAATQTALGTVYGLNSTASPYNSFYGYQAGNSATLNNNTYIGYQAAYTGGNNDNVAIGYKALYTEGNTGNGQNVAIGSGASQVSLASAYNNVYVGYHAGIVATSGASNTCVGATAGRQITTAGGVTCVGADAGAGLTTGNSGTYIGAGVTASSTSAANEIVIGPGNGPTGKGSNTGFIQPNGGGVYQGNNSSSWSTTSDFRLKKNIVDNNEGLDKISQIRVRNFEYRTAEEVTELPSHTVIDKQGVQLGVIAQELQQICPDCVKEESTGVISVDSDNIFWHMVNAIKDLKALIDTQATEIAELKAKVGA
jgi:Chaperone of endosialidase